MNKRTIHSITFLALPLALLSACGEDSQRGSVEGVIANDNFQPTSLAITGLNSPHLLQPIEVTVAAEVSAKAFETNIDVGLRTLDGSVGCVLGAMSIDPPEGEDQPALDDGELTTWSEHAEFIINSDCAPLAGRDDLELFISFDPWHELDGETYLGTLETEPAFDLFTIVSASTVSVEGCDSCETTYELADAVGLDAELRELNLSSVVAVVPVAGEDGTEPVATTTHADFTLSMSSRVVGLDKATALTDGLLRSRHTIRPLGSSDAGLPLVELRDAQRFETKDIVVPGPSPVTTVVALHIEDATRDAIVDGVWSNVDEFELVSCLESEFEQAVFSGEDAPRDNDCAGIPVVVVRQPVGIDGLPLPGDNPGAANARSAEVYADSWGGNAGYGFGYSGLSFQAWLDVNSSDGPSSTYGGVTVYNAGSWYEVGVESTATVFGQSLTLIDIFATFIGYEFGGGGVSAGATLLGNEFMPEFELQLADSQSLSLQQMFDAAGVDADPSLTLSYPLLGKSFDDGCDDVGASVTLDASVGLDTDETSVVVSSTHQGVEVAGTIAPFFDVSVVASASTGSFLGASAGITAALTLLNITLPFTVAVEVIDYDPLDAMRLSFNEYAGAQFTTLSGYIKFVFKYKDWLGNTVTHDHTIATWSGFSAYEEFFNLTQHVNIGNDAPGTWCTASEEHSLYNGDFNGDGVEDYLCHRSSDGNIWADYGGTYGATNWSDSSYGECLDDAQVVIGDFDGDGHDDLFCRGNTVNTKWIDYADNSGHFGGPDWLVNSSWCKSSNQVIRAADYNLDGKDDLFCYRPSDGTKWIDYADANGQFGGTDWTGTSLPDILPSFVSVGTVAVEETWVTVNLPQSFTSPVIIAGPASFNGSDPAVVAIRNVTSNSFQIKVKEWDYLDGNHAIEDVAWMAIESGVNVASDGTIWEAGTLSAGGSPETKTTTNFASSFSSAPYLFATPQTENGSSTVSARVDTLGVSSFQVLLDEQESLTDGHAIETVGYLALSSAPSETGSHDFYLGSVSVDENWTTVDGVQLMMQEEISLDPEVDHASETVHVFGIQPKYGGAKLTFAQDVTYNGTDSASVRMR